MGLFKKLFAVTTAAAVAAGGVYLLKNKDKIQNKIKAKKQSIALDLEVFNKAHEEYQNALDAQSNLEEETQYFDEYSKYYNLLKESYVKVQHDILSNQDESALAELNELKQTISKELEEGLSEFEKVEHELAARKEEIESTNMNVETAKQLYEAAKENIEAHGKKYLKGIVDPVKKVLEQEFKTFDLEDVEEKVAEVSEDVKEKVQEVTSDVSENFEELKEEKLPEITTPLNNAIDKTQESINRLLNTIRK